VENQGEVHKETMDSEYIVYALSTFLVCRWSLLHSDHCKVLL